VNPNFHIRVHNKLGGINLRLEHDLKHIKKIPSVMKRVISLSLTRLKFHLGQIY